MRISFSPVRVDLELELARAGDVLLINGERLDLSGVPEGGLLPRAAIGSELIAGDVRRVGGELQLRLRLPIPVDAPESALHPSEIVAAEDGPISLPTLDPEAS